MDQGNAAKDIDVKGFLPFRSARLGYSLDGVERPMIHDYAIETAPARESEVNGFVAEGEVGEVAWKDFYLGGILVVKLVERAMGTGDYEEKVALLEKVIGYGLADAWSEQLVRVE